MAAQPLHTLVRRLHRAAAPPEEGGLTDTELLRRWSAGHDAAAFELLVWRHGPMILAACRRLLRDGHAAEDAFQATWLVLVRRAASVRDGAALAAWLHRVACRVALRLRGTAARRAAREQAGVGLLAGTGEDAALPVHDAGGHRGPRRGPPPAVPLTPPRAGLVRRVCGRQPAPPKGPPEPPRMPHDDPPGVAAPLQPNIERVEQRFNARTGQVFTTAGSP